MKKLSETESGILRLLADDHLIAEVAKKRGCSVHTVRNHLKSIRIKLGVRTTTHAVVKYIKGEA